MIDVCILGTGGMMPLPDRHLSSCMVRNEGRIALIDAGEGTKWQRSVMVGLYMTSTSFTDPPPCGSRDGTAWYFGDDGSQGRKDPITIVGPEHSLEVIQCLCIVMPLAFRVNVLELPDVSEIRGKS